MINLFCSHSRIRTRKISIDIQADPPSLLERDFILDQDKILQLLLNILINAINASPENSAIEISLRQETTHSGTFLVIVFRDHGPGIPPEILDQIFTPYFTTRAEGTGLGLALAKNIAESHHGSITATNAIDEGAIFKILLPVGDHASD